MSARQLQRQLGLSRYETTFQMLHKLRAKRGDAESIWRTYTTLTRVEAAFRSMKTDRGTRPIYPQGGQRTEAHLFLSILAYHMLINIEHRLKATGENMRWHTLREHLASHQRSTVIWTNKEKET